MNILKLPRLFASIPDKTALFRNLSVICKPEDNGIRRVTILGSMKPLGGTIALLLKQCCFLDEVRIYSENTIACEIAMDICAMDTKTKIKAYTGGPHLLKDAIIDANIIIICGGDANKLGQTQKFLFEQNADAVRNFAVHVAEFNPNAILCIVSPPINSMVPMVCEEYKKAGVFDPRKIIGVTNLSSIRANSAIAPHLKENPIHVLCATIGGNCPNSTVAVFSQSTPKSNFTADLARNLQDAVRKAELHVLERHYLENAGSCFLSTAFAVSRFTTSLIKAINGEENCIECAFVRQKNYIGEFLPYLGTMVKLGKEGVEETYMPKLDKRECDLLQKAYPHLKNAINLGESYVNGNVVKPSRLDPRPACEIVDRKKTVSHIGDVRIDFDPKQYPTVEIVQ